ncbi:hypothetical protein ACILFN_10895 [Capnocytophaga canimorsus]|uniref:hypothetical protein n=1 Tax=Capnocytophaga canimorsus TaxID=28188 RepID=UPI0037D79490
MEKFKVKELEDKFENFIFNIDNYVESIQNKAKSQGLDFDLSIKSVDLIEKYIVNNDITIENDDYNDLSAYLGEVVRRNFQNAQWKCNLDKVNNSIYYGFPVIEGHSTEGILLSPFHLIKAFILRKKERLLLGAIENQINPELIDWSDFPTEKQTDPICKKRNIMSYTQDNFQDWIFYIDDKMDDFTQNFAQQHHLILDYSIQSLDDLEQWIFTNFENNTLLIENAKLLDLLTIYIGETFRKHIGGKWVMDTENKKNAYYMLPVLTDKKYKVEKYVAPSTFATACISRKKGNYISTILKNNMADMGIAIEE